jgi:hypothetical protein
VLESKTEGDRGFPSGITTGRVTRSKGRGEERQERKSRSKGDNPIKATYTNDCMFIKSPT